MTLLPDRLRYKVHGRETAKLLIEMLKGEIDKLNDLAKDSFWGEFGDWIDQNRPLVSALQRVIKGPSPMTDAEARTFGQSNMHFGKYKGDLICNIPLTYFDYMIGQDDHFMDGNAKRYLQNEKIAEELRRQIGDE